MLVLLYFSFLMNAKIPKEFKDLADRAISNSKTKIQRDKRVDTAYPGDYSFTNVEFMLKRTLSSPTTNDIKGYAIENLTVAIVKRKSFNLKENFVFVDPLDQKLYDMTNLVASDDKVNIYQTKDLTVFDIMTNFNYHGKTDKAFSPKINLNWDELNAGPELKTIPQISGFQYGIGAYGIFTIDTSFKFNSMSDIMLSASVKINIKSAATVAFQDGDSESSEEFTLFKLPSIPIKGLGISFDFVGIEIVIQPYIKCDATMSDVSIKVPNKINYFKGYEFVGTKKISITSFSVVDTKWDIKVYNIPEGNTLDEIIEQLKQASFHMIPAIRIYLSVEISLGGIESNFDVGLKVPFAFDFTFDKDKCLFPYLYGNINIGLQSFYYFSGISITYKTLSKGFKSKTKKLINGSSNSLTFFNIDTGMLCIGEANKVMEGSDSVLQQGEDRTYLIENNVFNGPSYPIQLIIEAKDKFNNLISARSLPFTTYNNNKKAGTHLIVTSSQPPNVYWYFSHYVTVKKTETKKILGFIPKKYDYYQTELHTSNPASYNVKDSLASSGIDVKPSMTSDGVTVNGNCKIYYLRDISINKVFHIEKNSMFITTIPCESNVKYALITLKKDGSTQIDDTAKFYSDTMLSDSFASTGYFQASIDHYQLEFDEFDIKNPMLLEFNVSISFNKDGEQLYNLGGISTELLEKRKYSAADARLDNTNFKFHVAKEYKPLLLMSYKTTIFNENSAVPSSIRSNTYDYSDFQKYYYLKTEDGSSIKYHFERVQPRASIQSNLITGENIIAPVFTYDYNKGNSFSRGDFEIETEKDHLYFVLEVILHTKLLFNMLFKRKYYIIIKCNGVTPLVENVIRITNNVFCIPCKSIKTQIPFRRIDNDYGKLKVDLLITEFNDLESMNLNQYGERIELTYLYQIKSFIVRKSYQSDIVADNDEDLSPNFSSFILHSFPIDNETIIISYLCLVNRFCFTLYLNDVNIEEGDYMVSYDVSYIKQLLNNSRKNSFSIFVTTESKSIKAIRCKDKIVEIGRYGAKFTFDKDDEDDIIDFYAVCNNETNRMCEITQTSKSGEFQLLEFPNRDGLNITGRGMLKAIIHAPENTSYSYYKTFDGSIEVVRSYPHKTKITVVVQDIYPKKKTKSHRKVISSEVTDDNYRQFCINDESGNILPFSLKYISENIDVFMKAIGARKDFDITQYDFAENGCIVVDHDALEENTFNTLPHSIIDLTVSDGDIKYNKKGVSFNPMDKKGKIAGIVVAAVLGVVIIVIAVSIFVTIRLKNKKESFSGQADTQSITPNTEEQNNNQTTKTEDI